MLKMHRTPLSLYYPATYLLLGGMGLVLAPQLALTLFFSNGHHGDVMPRLVGVLLFALGVLIAQVIRYRLEVSTRPRWRS